MSCGDRYAYLIRTAAGATPEDPWVHGVPGVADELDVITWADAARELRSRIERDWRTLVAAETGAGAATAPESPEGPRIQPDLRAYLREVDDLPGLWGALTGWPGEKKRQVERIIANMRDGVCLLERIHDATAATGIDAPSVPKRPVELRGGGFWSSVGDVLGPVIVVGLVAGGIYVTWRVTRARPLAAVQEAA